MQVVWTSRSDPTQSYSLSKTTMCVINFQMFDHQQVAYDLAYISLIEAPKAAQVALFYYILKHK